MLISLYTIYKKYGNFKLYLIIYNDTVIATVSRYSRRDRYKDK